MPNNQDLAHYLDSCDLDALAKFFQGMPEKERREHAAQCREFYRGVHRDRQSSGHAQWNAAAVAFFCTATFSELSKVARWTLPGDSTFEILADRKPDWTDKWADLLLSTDKYWVEWPRVRRLVRAGLISEPEHVNYVLGMIGALANRWQDKRSVQEKLLDDPELLDSLVWRLFEHEGGGENSLAKCDRFENTGWAHALIAFSEQGRLSRERLLDSCLSALQSDFNHYRAKWFATFYDKLKPTIDEEQKRAPVYLSLLGMSAPNVVTWAFKRVKAQSKQSAYQGEALCLALSPVLQAKSKGLVNDALKLVSTTAKAQKPVRLQACLVAVSALAHEVTEVQESALTIIEEFGGEHRIELQKALLGYLELVSPSLRSRLDAQLSLDKQQFSQEHQPPEAQLPSEAQQSSEAQRSSEAQLPSEAQRPSDSAASRSPEATLVNVESIPDRLRELYRLDELSQRPQQGGQWSLPAASFEGSEFRRLVLHAPLTPITELDQLLELAAQVLEDSVGPDEVELALDALSRLCDLRPADFEIRTGPLLKRVRQLIKRHVTPFGSEGPAADFCGLLHAWITGETARISSSERHGRDYLCIEVDGMEHSSPLRYQIGLGGVLSRRSYLLSQRIAARQRCALLSTPSHAGAWLDPLVLAERCRQWQGEEPPDVEVVLAMLRLAPENRVEALETLSSLQQEWVRAIRYALGENAAVGKSATLWIAAARARAPFLIDEQIDKAFPGRGPDAGQPATYHMQLRKHRRIFQRLSFDEDPIMAPNEPDCVPLVLQYENRHNADAYFGELQSLGSQTENSLRWEQSVWPQARESLFAASLVQLVTNMNWSEAQWVNKVLLEPLLDSTTPLREMGACLLVAGLGGKEPGEHGLAVDVAILAVEDGRLGSDNLGSALHAFLASDCVKPARYAKTLMEVARASAAHALVVKLALEHCLDICPNAPRDFAKVVDVLVELSVELGYGIGGVERDALAALKTGGKLGKTLKALLAVPSEDDQGMQNAHATLLEMRVAAASTKMLV